MVRSAPETLAQSPACGGAGAGDGGARLVTALEVHGIAVRYRNGALGVEDVSFGISEGAVVALFGPNGAGKTTTVRAVSGFLRTEGARVVRGSIKFNDRDITNLEPHVTRSLGVSCVPERDKVFANLTVGENLRALGQLPPKTKREAAYARIYDLFPVLKERDSQPAGQLSGGQRQMLAIARSLVTKPKLLVVDEMTLGIHHSLQAPLFDAIRQIASEGTSVLLVDESAGFALDVADFCYLLREGRIVDSGPTEKFRGSEMLIAGYVQG